MQTTSFALCLTVDDVASAADFYITHFGFQATVALESFVKLAHGDLCIELCFMQRGSETLPEGFRERHADGAIIAFVVKDAKAEEARLRASGVTITMPLQDDPWGERLFQVRDPNDVPVQLVEWVAAGAA